jgi:hypothetical protein
MSKQATRRANRRAATSATARWGHFHAWQRYGATRTYAVGPKPHAYRFAVAAR